MKQFRHDPQSWKSSDMHNFWKEIAPYDHVVQLYEQEDVLIEMLVHFILDGVHKKEGIIAIVTEAHRMAIDKRLQQIQAADRTQLQRHYFAVDAHALLASIRREGMLQRRLFIESIAKLVQDARKTNKKVRVFSEMVTITWQSGAGAETHRLEDWWNYYCEREVLGVWHAYPAKSFTAGSEAALQRICCSHAKMIAAPVRKGNYLQYRRLK